MKMKKVLFWVLPVLFGVIIASVTLLIENPTNMLRSPIHEVQFVQGVQMVHYYGWIFPVRCKEIANFGIFIEGPACGTKTFSGTLFVMNIVLWSAIVLIIFTLVFFTRSFTKNNIGTQKTLEKPKGE
jgi:hypothetical protein